MKNMILTWGLTVVLLATWAGGHPAAAETAGDTGARLDARIALSSLVSLADSHLGSLVDIMNVLALTRAVKSGEWETMLPLLAMLKREHIPGAYGFARPDGDYHTVGKGRPAKCLGDGAYFSRAMSGQPVMGALVLCRFTGKKVAVISAPVKKGGRGAGALVVSVFLEDFTRLLTEQLNLPDTIYFFAVDGGGRIALHSDVEMILKSRDFFHIKNVFYLSVEKMLTEKEGSVTFEHDGISQTVIFMTSPLTGWRFAIGAVGPAGGD